MDMPFALTYTVRRASRKPDPYNPDKTVEDWNAPLEWTLTGFLASISSNEQGGEPGQERLDTSKVFTVPEPDADIQRGDRVIAPDGRTYEVRGLAASDVNPWTGWQPTTVAHLEEITG